MLRIALLALLLLLRSAIAGAEPITLQYLVNVTTRANLVPNGSTPHDERVGLSLGPGEAYPAQFDFFMTFDPAVSSGHSETGGPVRDVFFFHGTPTFSAVPLPMAVPLVTADQPGASVDNASAQTFTRQFWRASDDTSFTNYGVRNVQTVQQPNVVQSGFTMLLSRRYQGTLSGRNDPAFDYVNSLAYLNEISNDLEFDFSTWSYFYSTGDFTADSYNYRGTAVFVGVQSVPEPSTLLILIGGGLATLAGRVSRGIRLRRFRSAAVALAILTVPVSYARADPIPPDTDLYLVLRLKL